MGNALPGRPFVADFHICNCKLANIYCNFIDQAFLVACIHRSVLNIVTKAIA